MREYDYLQLGLLILLIGLFFFYTTLDALHYELTTFGENAHMTLWGIILLLVDAKGLSKKLNGGKDEKTSNSDDITNM